MNVWVFIYILLLRKDKTLTGQCIGKRSNLNNIFFFFFEKKMRDDNE